MQNFPRLIPRSECRPAGDETTLESPASRPRLAWSAYANVYDVVLCKTATYRAMLGDLLGTSGPLPALGDGGVVLDLGCGTGNLSCAILAAHPHTTLIAIDHDPSMAAVFEQKLSGHLSDKPAPGKAFFMLANITEAMNALSDLGVKADYAFLVNVLFLVPEAESMLRQIADGLQPGGELRLSNPHDKTDLDSLFDRFRLDLAEQNEFASLENEFNALKAFNDQQLSPMLHRFSQTLLVDTLKQAGFSQLDHVSSDHYGGQSVLVSARV